MKISASILAAEMISLGSLLERIEDSKIDYLHMDIMDGNFVPQISFGDAISSEVRKKSTKPMDVHLMVQDPASEARKYYPLKPEIITFHYEATDFAVRLCNEIRAQGIKAGLALTPKTPPEALVPILEYIDLILIMTVDPGFYGQEFFRGGLEKIQKTKTMIRDKNILLEVDGGVNASNFKKLSDSGVDIAVIGSALFKENQPVEKAYYFKSLTE